MLRFKPQRNSSPDGLRHGMTGRLDKEGKGDVNSCRMAQSFTC